MVRRVQPLDGLSLLLSAFAGLSSAAVVLTHEAWPLFVAGTLLPLAVGRALVR